MVHYGQSINYVEYTHALTIPLRPSESASPFRAFSIITLFLYLCLRYTSPWVELGLSERYTVPIDPPATNPAMSNPRGVITLGGVISAQRSVLSTIATSWRRILADKKCCCHRSRRRFEPDLHRPSHCSRSSASVIPSARMSPSRPTRQRTDPPRASHGAAT